MAKNPGKKGNDTTSSAVASKAAKLIHTSDSADVRSVAASALNQAASHDTMEAGEVVMVSNDTGPVVVAGVDMVSTPTAQDPSPFVTGRDALAEAYDQIAHLKHELATANEKLAEQIAYNQRRNR